MADVLDDDFRQIGRLQKFRAQAVIVIVAEVRDAVADVDGTPDTQRVAEQGRGGAVSLADRGTVYDMEFARLILDTAEKNSIPCQVKRFVSGGNDSSKIQRSGEGVRVAAISAPARYIHTASNVIREEDFLSIERLAAAVLRALK